MKKSILALLLVMAACAPYEPENPIAQSAEALSEALSQAAKIETTLPEADRLLPVMVNFARVQGLADYLGTGSADIETMIQVVMMESAAQAEEELREILAELDELTEKKRAMRAQLAKAKEEATALRTALYDEFKKRSGFDSQMMEVEETYPVVVDTQKRSLVPFAPEAGEVEVELTCPNGGEGKGKLTIEGPKGPIEVLESSLSRIHTSFRNPVATQLRVLASAWITNTCAIRMRYFVKASPVRGFDDFKLRDLYSSSAALESIFSDLFGELGNLVKTLGDREGGLPSATLSRLGSSLSDLKNRVVLPVDLQSLEETTDAIKDKMESLSELGQTEALRIQGYMNRRAKAFEVLSNMMRKFHEMSVTIIGNLK